MDFRRADPLRRPLLVYLGSAGVIAGGALAIGVHWMLIPEFRDWPTGLDPSSGSPVETHKDEERPPPDLPREPTGDLEPSERDAPNRESALALVDSLNVIPTRPSLPGYDRDCGPGEGCVFGPAWSDTHRGEGGRNGCDTRNDILRRDLVRIQLDPGTAGCVVLSGLLIDPYSDASVDFERGPDSSAVEVDHVVALSYAWDMGAAEWTQKRRINFANDQLNLLATSGSVNASKSDRGPADWLPTDERQACAFGYRYARVLQRWDLPSTRRDVMALRAVASQCPIN